MNAVIDVAESTETRQTTKTHDTVASLSDITKRYSNGVVALDGLSLDLRRGEVVALLGPNGAGKSTAVKLMMGLSTPTSGSVRIFGADPRNAAARIRTGVMLQVGRAPEMLRVREHLTVFRGYYPNPMPYADIVKAAGLEGIEDRMFGQISGGQKQRVLFAISLAGDPDLIFLDEPTVGLDIEEADSLAHRIVVINKGRVVCEGTPAEVKSIGAGLSTPSGNVTGDVKIIRCTTTLTGKHLLAMPGVSTVELYGKTTVITSTQPESTLREMLALDQQLHSLEVQSPALEDAFLALTADRS